MYLFENQRYNIAIAPGAMLLEGFALKYESELLNAISEITLCAPFRHMTTPGGFKMSVAMTNCGTVGWIASRKGYNYSKFDPISGKPWPDMPDVFKTLANSAAQIAGYKNFNPQGCLINLYEPGTKLSLHQDKDELDLKQPIVSVSLGLPAIFIFGGLQRSDKKKKLTLVHGDVVVWGGESRLAYHAISPLKDGHHDKLGSTRINLTFRKLI